MKKDRKKPAVADRNAQDRNPDVRGIGKGGREDCRCKEVSKKTLPEMLKLAISDLTFWKKGK